MRRLCGALLLLAACSSKEPVSGLLGGGEAGAGGEATAGAGGAPWAPPQPELPAADFDGEFLLSELGLYTDITTKAFAPDLLELEPQFVLWSDSAEKRRFLRLPPGTEIDTTDMDHWTLPVGAQAFKQFSIDGKLLETRLVARTGEGRFDYWMGAFIWNDDESDAVFSAQGASNVRGTEHDVPTVKQCGTCHNGETGRYLGVSALQLGWPGGALATLAAQGRLSAPPKSTTLSLPGAENTRAALGYLHANCGHCHNSDGTSWPDTNMVLRLSFDTRTLEETGVYDSAIGVNATSFIDDAHAQRIAPGDPEASAVLFRMKQRGAKTQMPPFATEIVDEGGIRIVERFITELGEAP
jgi:hypothetical protein